MHRIIQPQLGFDTYLYSTLESLPKVELHRHLTGSIRPATILDICRDYEIELPYSKGDYDINWIEERIVKHDHSSKDLDDFIKSAWRVINKLIPGAGVAIVPRIVHEAIEDASEENVKYLELRIAPYGCELPHYIPPYIHDENIQKVNFHLDDFLNALTEGAEYNTLNGITTRIILSLSRHSMGMLSERERKIYSDIVLNTAYNYRDRGIVGFDLAGSEKNYPPALFRDFFNRAKEAGFKITIHAGETGNAQNIKDAIDLLHADRIGHGISLCQDDKILNYLLQRGTPLEICPTSNIVTGVFGSLSEYPVKSFYESGIKITINTDDPVVCNTCLAYEYYRLIDELGFNIKDIKKIILRSAEFIFASEPEKEAVKAYIENNLLFSNE